MKKKLIIALVVFSAIGAVIFYFLTTGNIGEQYNTAEVQKGEVSKSVQDVGKVSSKNIRQYYGNGSYEVEEMSLALGDRVEQGQVLIKYEDDLDLEIEKVNKQIEALEATYSDALSGTAVESVNNARIEIAQIRNNLDLAINNRDRMEKLYNSDAVPLVELEQAINTVEQLQSNLSMAQNNYNQLVKGVSGNIKRRYEAEIDVLLLTLESLKENKENYQIVSAIEGIVTEVNTFEGDRPSPGTKILEIQDPSKNILLVDFMVEDALKIREGMQATIEDNALGITIDNLKVDQVHPTAFITLSELGVEENRQTVEISLSNASEDLPYGLEVKTQVMIEEPREALLIPKGAVYQQEATTYVKVLEDQEPVEKEIVTGVEFNNTVEVKEGLTAGELVIINYEEE